MSSGSRRQQITTFSSFSSGSERGSAGSFAPSSPIFEQRGGTPTVEQTPFDEAWWLHVDVDALTPDRELALNTDVVGRTERWLAATFGVDT